MRGTEVVLPLVRETFGETEQAVAGLGLAHLAGFWDDLGISGMHPTPTLIFPSRPRGGPRGIRAGRVQELPGDS